MILIALIKGLIRLSSQYTIIQIIPGTKCKIGQMPQLFDND